VLAFAEGAGKKVFASLEILLTSRKELLKSIGKLRKVLAFAEGVVKKVLASLEMCWHSLKALL
jgi:hypothetical protein